MLRFLFVLVIVSATLGTWLVREQPSFLLNIATSEWGSFRSWIDPPETTSSPLVPIDRLPLVAENRTASTVFQPRLKSFAPRLSVPTAHAAIVLDAESGQQLYAHNADDKRQIASLTKLFTALIVVERVKNLDEAVTIDEEAVYADGTRVGCPRSGFCNGVRLHVGEQVTVRHLLQAALMNSANDAAIALGKHIGGSQEGFAQIMNTRAQELGLVHSHFCTPSGLEPEGRESDCYSSASDIALIAATTLKQPVIWDIMQQVKTTFSSIDGSLTHEIFNTDQLLGTMPNLVGTKTGFTPLAGYSLLAVATDTQGKHPVIAVVLNDPYRWDSIRSMFSWSFQAYDWI